MRGKVTFSIIMSQKNNILDSFLIRRKIGQSSKPLFQPTEQKSNPSATTNINTNKKQYINTTVKKIPDSAPTLLQSTYKKRQILPPPKKTLPMVAEFTTNPQTFYQIYTQINSKQNQDQDQDQIESSQLQKRQSTSSKVGPQFILIGPFDSIQKDLLQAKMQKFITGCTKRQIIDWIRFLNHKNQTSKVYKNLQKIEDQQFWCNYIRRIFELLLKHSEQIQASIKTLPEIYGGIEVTFTRKQIFLLIASMFFSIIPNQSFTISVSFVDLMTIRDINQKDSFKAKSAVRLQKLICVINYLKYMVDHQDIFEQKVIYHRAYNDDRYYLNDQINKPLLNATVRADKNEAGYGKGIIIDFANSNIGGGFLTNGSAQQQILFAMFPELILTRLLCQPLKDEQALIVKGARRYNNYEGYSTNFKFKSTYHGQDEDADKSIIVAVDALDYTKGQFNRSMQYNKKFIRRQLHKMTLGLVSADYYAQQYGIRSVYTGRWGCGVFGADQYLKFCIQWIACSECGLEMIFMADDERTQKQLNLLIEEIKDKSTLDLLNLIQQFGSNGKFEDKGLLNYLKWHA